MQITVEPNKDGQGYNIVGHINPLEVLNAEMPDLVYRVGEEVVKKVTTQLMHDYGHKLFEVITPDVLGDAVHHVIKQRIQEIYEYEKHKREVMGSDEEDE